MYAKAFMRLATRDVLVERAEPHVRWRVVDHWRDVYELETLDQPRRRRFAYADELNDSARFRRVDVDPKAPRVPQR